MTTIYRDMVFGLTLSLLAALLLAGCSSASQEGGGSKTASATPTAASSNSAIASAHGSSAALSAAPTNSVPASAGQAGGGQTGPGSAGGIKWTAPAKWKVGPERQMRAATYFVPAASGDSEDGECGVFIGIGGTVQANLDRWVAQFEQPDGKASDQIAKQKKETINGLSVTTIDLTGTFTGGGPTMGQGGGKKAGYRLLGAIVEGAQGNIFFKFTGPAKTVAAAQNDFQAMLKSLSGS